MEYLGARMIFGTLYSVLLALPVTAVLVMPPAWREMGIVRLLGVAYFFAWVFGSGWLTRRAARYWAIENRTFDDAFARPFSDARVPLSFLPVIGHWFTPRE
jgi:hypothetical protein